METGPELSSCSSGRSPLAAGVRVGPSQTNEQAGEPMGATPPSCGSHPGCIAEPVEGFESGGSASATIL
jgi:hypothetical protein